MICSTIPAMCIVEPAQRALVRGVGIDDDFLVDAVLAGGVEF